MMGTIRSTLQTERSTKGFMKAEIVKDRRTSQKQSSPERRATHKGLIAGMLAIAVIPVVSDASLGPQGLQVVASPFINNSTLSAAAIIGADDIWAVGDIGGSTASAEVTLAEHFDGNAWSVVSTPAISGSMFSSVAGVAGNDIWAVG